MEKDLTAVMRYSLGLGYDCEADKTLVDEQVHEIDVYISHSRDVSVFSEMGKIQMRYDHRRKQTWHHLNLAEFKRFVHRRVPRIQSFVGEKTIESFWTGASNRFTHEFENWANDLLKGNKDQTKMAKLLRCGFDVTDWILYRSVSRVQQRRSREEIQHLRVDEKAIQRGRTFVTIISAIERDTMLDPVEGRDKVSTKYMFDYILGVDR
ncbi:MAG: hypothetical protein OXI44_04155 [Bacteroidota bacterium]|nr:hypothetical protein [Bacteroidota bacterium]